MPYVLVIYEYIMSLISLLAKYVENRFRQVPPTHICHQNGHRLNTNFIISKTAYETQKGTKKKQFSSQLTNWHQILSRSARNLVPIHQMALSGTFVLHTVFCLNF